MDLVTLENWRQWNGSCTLLPYIRKIELGDDQLPPLFWDGFWRDASPYACILESGKGGRYTIAGLLPSSVISGKGRQVQCTERRDSKWVEAGAFEQTPLESVRVWMKQWMVPKIEGIPDCCGGALGFWSYDMARSLEKLPEWALDDLEWPDFLFMRFEQLWIADQEEKSIYLVMHTQTSSRLTDEELANKYPEAKNAVEKMERKWRRWCESGRNPAMMRRNERMLDRMREDRLHIDVEQLPGLTVSMSKDAYQDAVRRIQDYIAQGDVFQVNMALRQSLPVDGLTGEEVYEWLRRVNPSPYMGMMRTPSFSLVSASPELLVKLKDGKLSTRPIAGTRRRGGTPEEDLAMEDELRSSDKERAEHIMLVDLERNDLGRVSAFGTVRVPELLTIERYSHVMHLVSQVEGELACGKDALDVVAAVFPGGTITGAPKIRTMEIIEELEPVRRGPYTGSMGWIDYSGNMEFNIIIRTIALADGVCHIQAGAGIVIDSDPRREYYECLSKAKALWKAVQYAQRFAEAQDGRNGP